jgi:hypothetical protein
MALTRVCARECDAGTTSGVGAQVPAGIMLLFVEPRLEKLPGGTLSPQRTARGAKADLCLCYRMGSRYASVGSRRRGRDMPHDAHGWRVLRQVVSTVSTDARGRRRRRRRRGSVRHAELTAGELVSADGPGDSSLAHDFLVKLSASALLRLAAFLAGLHTLLVEVMEHPRFVDRLATKAPRDAVAASSVVFCHAPPPALLQFLQSAPHAPSGNGYNSRP